MADNTIIKVALFGGAAYLAYQYFFASPTTASTSTTGTTGSTGSGTPAKTTAPPANPPAKTYPPLSQIFALMNQYAQADWNEAGHSSCDGAVPINQRPTMTGGPPSSDGRKLPGPTAMAGLGALICRQTPPMFSMDDWNAYAVRAGGPDPMPDPGPVFPGVARSQLMTAQDYWSGMSAALALMGLSGYYRFGRAA